MAKGIRVSQLAKELGVPSKDIVAKCHKENLGDTVTSHSVTLSLGLAETIRQWFSGGDGGTAVEIAKPIDAETKAKVRSTRKATTTRKAAKAKSEPAAEPAEIVPVEGAADAVPPEQIVSAPSEAVGEPETADLPVAEQAGETTTPAHEQQAPSVAAQVQAKASPAPQAPEATAPSAADHAPAVAAPAPVHATEVSTQPGDTPHAREHSVTAPASTMSKPKPATVAEPHPPHAPHAAATATTPAEARAGHAGHKERRPVVPKPPKLVLQPAKIQGPRVVREEKPDIVPAPRPRRPVAGTSPTSSFTQARPQAGRGVRVNDEEGTPESGGDNKKTKGARSLSSRRRGADGRRGEAMEKLKEYTEADLLERRDRLNAASAHRTAFDSHLKKSAGRGQHGQAKSIVQRGEPVEIEEPISVRTLSAALGVKANDIIGKLMRAGVFATVNQALSVETAESLALEYDLELKIKRQKSLEDVLMEEIAARKPDPANLVQRPPVVTILGHVGHGKTSLLDKIRKANVAAGESGGITQHTAAWMVQLGKKRVTFIDTPGHEAFTSMRARGANMTDVVVLVVSAAEGIQPQTIESINHARAADVPIVVALNKIDRPDANPDMVLGQLAAQNLNPVEWGGDTEVVRTSAVTGQGIPELIELLDYQAELLELKYDPTAPARGSVIEARVDEGLGDIATVLVQDGVLKLGDIVLSGPGYGRVRNLINDRGERIGEAPAGTPVMVSGLNELPGSGDKFYVVDNLDRARSIAEERASMSRQELLAQQNRVTADNLLATIKAGDIQTINLIVKGDVQGSVETLNKMLADTGSDEVKARVIHSGVGAVNESDVQLAIATKGKPTDNKVAIIGFHVTVEEAARTLAEQHHVDVKLYRVIYEIFDDLKKALSGMLAPEEREKLHGHVEIRQVFKVSRLGNIGGCLVTDGHVQRGSKLRLVRNGTIIAQDLAIDSLKRLKDDVREVKQGLECGIKIAGYDDIKVGDVLEAYARETIERTL